MNKELSSILKARIQNLPFIDKLAGLVQTVEITSYVDDETNPANVKTKEIKNKFPVSYDVTGVADDCTGPEKDLIPDSSRKSITYFEDFGSTVTGNIDGIIDFSSKLRLICWLNRDRLVGDAYKEISAFCISAIIGKLTAKQFSNAGIFTQLNVKPQAIQPQNANLFSNYTYDQNVRQYLRPPFEFFGIDLLCTYKVSGKCYDQINFNIEKTC